MLFPGDLYASLKGATKDGKMIGSVARVPPSVPSGRLTQDTVKLVLREPNPETTSYLYWILRTPQYRDYCEGRATGSAVVALSRLDFLCYPVPPLTKVRKCVVDLLNEIESHIEVNRRMNETLEAMARAIFKDWFVDFGPTRAKIEGRARYLAPEIWAIFPEALDDAGKPDGWISSTIGQEVDVVGGSTPSTKEPQFWGGDIAWATPKDLSSLTAPVLLGTERQITSAGLSQIGSGLLPTGTVLLSSRAPIGYMAVSQIPTAVNQGFIAMVCQRRLSNVFVWLWTQANMETVLQKANGSTFQEISKANFRPIAVTVARPDVLRAFDETVSPIFSRIVSNEMENRSLAEARDYLLAKLTSGEIRLRDAEKIAEAAA
jgi:restriction endonuclease S subunit